MYIRSLDVRSLRCFESAHLKLRYPAERPPTGLHAPNVNLILGNNGTGKSTILRAAALASLSPVFAQSAGFVPYKLIRNGAKTASCRAELELHPQQKETTGKSKTLRVGLALNKSGDSEILKLQSGVSLKNLAGMFQDHSPAFLVVGYGATRRVEDAASFSPNEQLKRRVLRYQRVAGLFESHISLMPLGNWLPQMKKANPGRHKQVVTLLSRLLPEDAGFEGKQETSSSAEYLFKIRDIEAPFGALSDGYRAYIGWISDLLYHICMGAPSGAMLFETCGVVLVDEIDLHLHPEWQRTVIGLLSKTLPNLQFFFTTHSPIVAGSVQKENIFLMEVDSKGTSSVSQLKQGIYGQDAQQVLLSPYFGLETTRAPGFIDEMEALSRQLKPGKPEIALQIMRRMAGSKTK